MATKKYEINQLQSDGSLLTLHPATDASIVYYNDVATELGTTTVQGAIKEIVTVLNTLETKTGVTGVKGNSESSYRQGNVNITATNVGAYTISETNSKISTDISGHNSNSSAHSDIRTKITNDISSHNSNASAHSDIRKLITAAQSKADSAFSLASGRSKAVAFETVAAMTTALKAANSTDYKIGDQIFIKATDTPDYWVTAVNSTKTGTYGYYELQILETSIDLTDYQTKTDNTLSTTSKTIVGAINEVKTTADNAGSSLTGLRNTINSIKTQVTTLTTRADQAETDIDNITNGTLKVGKAAAADSATTATTCTGNAATATKLQTARTISLTGAITGSVSFNGSANASIATTLANSGVTAGTYSVVSVNAKGIITKGAQFIEVGTDTAATAPSSNLAIGGI